MYRGNNPLRKIEITVDKVKMKLKKLNTNKSAGPDRFYPRVILSRATKGNSNPRLKGNRKGIIVKGKEFYIPILNTFPTR